jgi:hypothetical protein
MYTHISGKFTIWQILPLYLASCLAFIPQSSTAQMAGDHTVVQYFPALPILEPDQAIEFFPGQQNFQPVQVNQHSQNFQRFLVYVDGGNSQTLQQVRWVEPNAFVRQFQGRSVIQSGIFSQLINAENRVRELQASGINNVRVINYSDGQQVAWGNTGQQVTANVSNVANVANTIPERAYFAVIPAAARDIPVIAANIRRASGFNDLVLERQQPRGPHVAVGPFTDRNVAQAWDRYLRELGFRNSRLFYGR